MRRGCVVTSIVWMCITCCLSLVFGYLLLYHIWAFAEGIAPEIIVSEKFAEKLLGETYVEAVLAEYKEPYNEETEQAAISVLDRINEISRQSRLLNYNEMKTTENKAKVLGNSISIIMAMLAILNIATCMNPQLLKALAWLQNRLKRCLAWKAQAMQLSL